VAPSIWVSRTARPVNPFGVLNTHLPPAAGMQKAAPTKAGGGELRGVRSRDRVGR
jgi:hypothetical protein